VENNRYRQLFDEERDILEIAKDLDIKCVDLTDERDRLIEILGVANRVIELASSIINGSAKNITPALLLIEKRIEEYYEKIEELSNENSCNKDKKE
jgi:uncharacterized protein with von Willebrand factor type A (vWA) domain